MIEETITKTAYGCFDQYLSLHRRVSRTTAGDGSGEATLNSMQPGGSGEESAEVKRSLICRDLQQVSRKWGVMKPPSLTVRVLAPRKLSTVNCDTIINYTVN